jgi:hypothetical protein
MTATTILGLAPLLPFAARRAEPSLSKETTMLTTISIAGRVSAQGTRVEDHADGRVTISTGAQRLTGWPLARRLPWRADRRAGRGGAGLRGGRPQAADAETLLNVSYDPTRELYSVNSTRLFAETLGGRDRQERLR